MRKMMLVLVAMFVLVVSAQAKEQNLLKALDTINLPAVSRFVAKDAFTKANGVVYIGDNFKQYILPLVEVNVPEAAVKVSELTRSARDLRIAAELGVDEKGEVASAHFFQLLSAQAKGQTGPLHTNGWANVAYIVGTDGNTWTVDACLSGVGWEVIAYPLGDRRGWLAGRRVLSR